MENAVSENVRQPGQPGRHEAIAESELFTELDALGLLHEQRIRSGVDREPVDLFAEDYTARTRGALEQDERQPLPMELKARRQPRDAAADDDHCVHDEPGNWIIC